MKKRMFTALAVFLSLIVAPYAFAAEDSEKMSTHKFLTLEDLQGMEVKTGQGDDLGSVEELVIDVDQGRLAYVVVTDGGILGLGSRTVLVPWGAFSTPGSAAEQDDTVLVLGIDKEKFQNAPQGDLETVLDRQQGVEIHRYYGVAPYWESGSQVQRGIPPGHQPKEMRGRQDAPGQEKRMDDSRQDPPGHRPIEERGR